MTVFAGRNLQHGCSHNASAPGAIGDTLAKASAQATACGWTAKALALTWERFGRTCTLGGMSQIGEEHRLPDDRVATRRA